MRRSKWFLLVAVLSAFTLIAAACNDDPDPEPEVEPEAEGTYLMGADGLLSDTYVVIEETNGMYFSGPARPEGPGYGDMVEAYREEFGEAPIQSFHGHTYDATMILLEAIADVAEEQADGSLLIDTTALMERMYETEGHEGLTGTLTCNAYGDCAAPRISVVQNTEATPDIEAVSENILYVFEGTPGELPEEPPEAPDYGGFAGREVTVPAGGSIQIASHQAISGEVASLGEDQNRGIELAIADFGDVNGFEVEFAMREDDECDAAGVTGAERIAANPDIVASIGTSCSGAAVPSAPVYSEAGIIMISGSNTAPFLTTQEGQEGDSWVAGYFRTAHNDEVQGTAAATFAYEELGARQAASIHDGDPYTQGLTSVFNSAFEELGGEIVVATSVGADDTDMRPVLTEISATEPDILFFPIFQPAGDHIAAQAKEFDQLDGPDVLMAADGLLSDTYIELPDTEDMYFSGPATPEGTAYGEFVDKYQSAYGELPIQAFHAHAYDSANLLFDAIEAVAVEEPDGSTTIDRRALIDELFAISDFEGLTGTLSCDDFGDCADPLIDIVRNTAEQDTIDQVRANVLFTFEPED
jgi:branched-chain amino acid transport system substrate-binding protein